MFYRVFIHIVFGLMSPAFGWYLAEYNNAETYNVVFIVLLFSLLGGVTNLLAVPFINVIFRWQYKIFWTNYIHRDQLPRYEDSESFNRSVYNFFVNLAALDGFRAYKINYDDFYNLHATLIITLFRVNNNIDVINKFTPSELKSEFNLFPSMIFRSKLSKQRLNEIKEEMKPKPARFSDIQDTKALPKVDHLSEDLLGNSNELYK